ncbi:hypothetical protein [Mesorhizobium sp. WSM3879]|uniref:hypothetical protein n=1 Tax=Mesorhizobium sp. WSM3879 TaxID=2029406 RepID=UPI00117C308B|nr:hypothetical protein [Mesorhizobium sp. WSM3879]
MAGAPKGAALEELVRAYFARQGFFALRGVSFRFDDEEVTDIDVWLYGRQSASLRTRTIVDVKDKRSPKAFERILWTRGVQLALGCDRAVVATTDTNPKIVRFAQQQKVALLTRQFLERLQKNVSTETRQSAEQFAANIQSNPNHKQDGDWLRRIADAKSALISLSGYPAFNKAISTFRFFGERVETRALNREQALRGAYIAAALACIALDSALERSVYEDTAARFRSIANGVTYGDAGDGRVQSSIDSVLNVLSGAMENGRVVATQARDAFERLFEQVRSDIIAEFFSREHNSASLFTVARELDERAHSIDPSTLLELSTEAKSVLGVFADFVAVKRGLLFGGQLHRGLGHSASEGGQSKFVDDKPPLKQDKLL